METSLPKVIPVTRTICRGMSGNFERGARHFFGCAGAVWTFQNRAAETIASLVFDVKQSCLQRFLCKAASALHWFENDHLLIPHS